MSITTKPKVKTATKAKSSAKAVAKPKVRTPAWRERNRDRTPMPSFHNARLAIVTLGIECRHDVFHDKMTIGYRGGTPHDVELMQGEVNDALMMALRRKLSDEFDFDLGDKHVRDAVLSLANENRHNPVADFLDEAEVQWDGVERLDRVAPDYLNVEDTPLNSACIRKALIAAVARVRQPGCKFDTIPVLEGPEGYNKSTAWRVLAGSENFSDEPIIGRDTREVQEQLAGVWIHESADLAGMKKAEVETVKTFASRTVDRARPAYGHFLKAQPRHCIMVGTTNSNEYLQSQTGNRRFWPMLVLMPIDIEKLSKDRVQIWAEAAHCERQGESLFLDDLLWPAAAVEQERRRVKDVWEDTIAESEAMRFHIVTIAGEERISTADIVENVLRIPPAQQNTSHSMRLANVMKHLGWKRHSNGNVTIGTGKSVKGYWREAPPEQQSKKAKRPKALPPSRAETKRQREEAEIDD